MSKLFILHNRHYLLLQDLLGSYMDYTPRERFLKKIKNHIKIRCYKPITSSKWAKTCVKYDIVKWRWNVFFMNLIKIIRNRLGNIYFQQNKLAGSLKARQLAKNLHTQRKRRYLENSSTDSSSKIGHDFRK